MKIPKLLYVILFLAILLGFWAVLNQTYVVHFYTHPSDEWSKGEMLILKMNKITGKINIQGPDSETHKWKKVNR